MFSFCVSASPMLWVDKIWNVRQMRQICSALVAPSASPGGKPSCNYLRVHFFPHFQQRLFTLPSTSTIPMLTLILTMLLLTMMMTMMTQPVTSCKSWSSTLSLLCPPSLPPFSSCKTVLTFTELHNAQCRQQLGVHCAKYFLPPSLRAKIKQCKLVPNIVLHFMALKKHTVQNIVQNTVENIVQNIVQSTQSLWTFPRSQLPFVQKSNSNTQFACHCTTVCMCCRM